jgi:hypothetical protein
MVSRESFSMRRVERVILFDYVRTTLASPQCVHGLDARFCSLCNKSKPTKRVASRHTLEATLVEILHFLNDQQVRATYGAVADVLNVIPRSMGARLGSHSEEASWVVSAWSGLPTDYSEEEMHPALRRSREIITAGYDLKKRLSAWKTERRI